jgi:hypothetical protein
MGLGRVAVVAGCATVLLAGCKKTEDSTANYTKAINAYYASRPACVWATALKLPAQVTTSDTSQTQGFDALVDQGLLQRTTAEKKRFLIGSKQVTNYDLTDKGRGAWTADTQQPGFGNFCYGTRTVATIDSATPTTAQPGTTTVVSYHAKVSGVPAWASAPETESAFPQIATDLSGPVAGSATLKDTDNGWVVTSGPAVSGYPAATHGPATAADGSIVQ